MWCRSFSFGYDLAGDKRSARIRAATSMSGRGHLVGAPGKTLPLRVVDGSSVRMWRAPRNPELHTGQYRPLYTFQEFATHRPFFLIYAEERTICLPSVQTAKLRRVTYEHFARFSQSSYLAPQTNCLNVYTKVIRLAPCQFVIRVSSRGTY